MRRELAASGYGRARGVTIAGALAAGLLLACGGQTLVIPADAGGDGGGSSSGGSSGGGSGGGSGSGSGSSSGSSGGSSGSSSGSSSGGSSGSSSGGSHEVPTNHRPSDEPCLQPAAPGDCQGQGAMGPGSCNSDSQCTTGTGGRCVESGGGVLYCACTYDACADDAACPTGQTCACHGSPYVGGQGNTCVPGNCRVDSDCGAGGYCSPAFSNMGCGGLAGYYCHTPDDQCVNDTDCQGGYACSYSTSQSIWTCQQQLLCG